MPGTLSPLIRRSLTMLRRRLVLARALRVAALLMTTLVAVHLACFALSQWPGLHATGLRVGLTACGAAALSLLVLALARYRRLDDTTLAARIERHHPKLGERLLSTVELAHAADAHGDPAFIAALAAATDRQLQGLDCRAVCPLHRPARQAALATASLLALVFLFAFSPRYARFCGRYFAAWSEAYTGFTLDVLPGDAWTARGRPATIEARLTLQEEDETLPAECHVVFTDSLGKPQRRRMDPAVGGRFLFSWPRFEQDVTFHVEAGSARVGPFRLTAVDPVELAGPPTIRVTPPAYVNPNYVPMHTLTDGASFTALQHGRIHVDLRFSARPVCVMLVLASASEHRSMHGVLVTDNGHATIELPADRCATFAATLHIEGEHGITTTQPLAAWTVRPDTPPHFTEPLRVYGVRTEKLRDQQSAALDDPLHLQASVVDAEGLHEVALEYRINDGPAVTLPWLDADGRLRLAIDRVLSLPRGMKEGDRFRFRLRVTDNRRAAGLGPQIAFSPAGPAGEERWLDLRVGKSADSLLSKEIAAQHGEIDGVVEQVRQQLQKEHDLLGQVRQASHRQAEPPLQQLAHAERLNQAAVEALDQLAAQFADEADLAPLAAALRAIAETELAPAAQAMQQFQRPQRAMAERTQDAESGEATVLKALQRLNDLARLAERLGQGRLDRLELERLALKEQELADRAEEMLAGAEPDAAALAELRAEQERVATRLRELTQRSEQLRAAVARDEAAEAKRLAEQAGRLAKEGAAGNGGTEPKLEQLKQLADGALKLAQQGGPEAKAMAKEAATAAAEAQQALAKGSEPEAMQKLTLTQKKLEGLAAKMLGPDEAKLGIAATLTQGQKMVQAAQQQLQVQPRLAPKALRQASGSLDRAARQMSQQLGQALPQAAGRPTVGAGGLGQPSRLALPAPLAKQLEPFQDKTWGELPGELKTQLLQAARRQFGDEYAPIIQEYFEQLAGTDLPRRAVPPSKQP